MSDDTGPPLLDGEWLATLRTRVERGGEIVACFDFDGTLAPLVADPDEAAIRPDIAEALRRLTDNPRVEVAVVSGRSLADLRDRVGIEGLSYAGNHGLEWDDGDGRAIAPAARQTRPTLDAAVDRLREDLAEVPGCRIEHKDLTATVHYRETPAARVPDVVETVGAVAAVSDDLRATRGKQVHELRPAAPAGKGLAVARLRERHPSAVPLFVGDDRTDEDGFRAVGDDGFGVLVGERSDSAAAVRVPDVDGVALLLTWLVQTCTTLTDPRVSDHSPSTG